MASLQKRSTYTTHSTKRFVMGDSEKWYWAHTKFDLQTTDKRTGPFGTRDTAICAALEELDKQGLLFKEEGETFYTGALQDIPTNRLHGAGRYLVKKLADWMWDVQLNKETFSEAWMKAEHNLTAQELRQLDDELIETFWKWVGRKNRQPVRFVVLDVEEHKR
jgi:hypothetical protein